jgi:uncharacterized protein with HEPN domain
MSRDDRLFLIHIEERIESIQEFVQDGKGAFLENRMAQEAVIRNFEFIGEAYRNVSDAMKKKYPEVPWQEKQLSEFSYSCLLESRCCTSMDDY